MANAQIPIARWTPTAVVVMLTSMLALVACSCSSPSAAEALTTYTVGPPGHQLRIAAAPSQHPRLDYIGTSFVVPGAARYRGTLALPGGGLEIVEISVSPGAIAGAHARWIINDDYNNLPEHLVTWHGAPADRGVIPCTTPAGPCSGYQGGMTVLRGNVLYDVFVQTGNEATARAVVNSFNIGLAPPGAS